MSTIMYDWRYEGHAGDSSVTWELTRQGKIVALRLTHTGLET